MKRDTSDVLQYVRSVAMEHMHVGGGVPVAPPVVAALINRMERMEERIFPADELPPAKVEDMPASMDAQQHQQQEHLLQQQQEWQGQPPQ